MDGDEKDLSCLHEDPQRAWQAAHQELLIRWWYAVALAPFCLVLFVGLALFPDSTSRIFDVFVGASLIWAMGVAVYTLYLFFFLRCPRCDCRFGTGPECCSCGLPRQH
jgi:hypothetical protein